MNVGQLKKILADLPDEMPVALEVETDEGDELAQGDLQMANVECRCDDVDRLYLFAEDQVVDTQFAAG